MQQLTGLDAAFLAMETITTTGHVGGVAVLDPSEAPQKLDLARLTELMGQRLPLVPVMRRRLLEVPLGLDQPYWIDDPDFDIEYHVREIALPRPGNMAQLTEQVSRLHARPLDRRRPLWEMYLITGSGEEAMRGLHQGAPLRHRRGVGCRAPHGVARSVAGGSRAARITTTSTRCSLRTVRCWPPAPPPGSPGGRSRACRSPGS